MPVSAVSCEPKRWVFDDLDPYLRMVYLRALLEYGKKFSAHGATGIGRAGNGTDARANLRMSAFRPSKAILGGFGMKSKTRRKRKNEEGTGSGGCITGKNEESTTYTFFVFPSPPKKFLDQRVSGKKPNNPRHKAKYGLHKRGDHLHETHLL